MPHRSPIEFQHATQLRVELHKPHAGIIEVLAVHPDTGDYFLLKRYQLHDTAKIAANKTSGVADPPAGWVSETPAERDARNLREEQEHEARKRS